MSTTPTQVLLIAVAIEIAAAKWVVASTSGGKPRRKALTQASPGERFAALLAELTKLLHRHGTTDAGVLRIAYEAGQEGFWLVRALRSRGFVADVIDPVSLQVDRRQRRAKTDRLDAEALVSALWRRHALDDHRALRLIHVPSEAAEDAREWTRAQDRLKTERRRCLDRISKKLRCHGIWQLEPRKWRKALRDGELRRFDGSPLGPVLQGALVVELDRVELVEQRLAEWERVLAEVEDPALERAAHLGRLRGIGPAGSRQLAMRLFWREFGNRRQVGSCVGLTGTPYDSGTLRQDQGISKAGDPKLRSLLVELAWLWLRYQPDSRLSQWFRERTQGAGSRGKRIMIVALARKLAVALWRYLKFGEVPEGARLKPVAA